MARKFKVPVIPATTQKNVRFPNDVIEEVELAIRGTGATFSAFVIEATRWALESLKEQEQDSDLELFPLGKALLFYHIPP